MPNQRVRCDIFCHVIDNFGDAGVCWRLARQLANEIRWSVRLFIDAPHVLKRIEPQYAGDLAGEHCRGVEIVHWTPDTKVALHGNVVIEAFGCRIPDHYTRSMASSGTQSVWINLEYLSAEAWTASCHALPSPDPASGMVKHFFFPGFSPSTGGLIREKTYSDVSCAYKSRANRRKFIKELGIDSGPEDLLVSIFCYPHSPIQTLIKAVYPNNPIRWLVSESMLTQPEIRDLVTGHRNCVSIVPFLAQDDYDRLLLSSDINFVRGEDSFVRAQWAMRPFVWHAYRQDGGEHEMKVSAFLNAYLQSTSDDVRHAVTNLWSSWNRNAPELLLHWFYFLAHQQLIQKHNQNWAATLTNSPDLASNLVDFCIKRL